MLHVIYRSYGGENEKGRPSFYTKRVALGSVLRALTALPTAEAEIVYLNDGPIPPDRLKIMRDTGEIVARSGLGNSGSLRTAFSLPSERRWRADDLVWFAEDDYLYRTNALLDLVSAGAAYADADYFGLYALIGNRMPNGEASEDRRIPENWRGGNVREINGGNWQKALSTTSTFGVRVKTVERDKGMMLAAMRCGGAFDHSTCLAYQGFTPFPLWFLLRGLTKARTPPLAVRAMGALLTRVGFNIWMKASRARSTPSLLVASDPSLITHMESKFLAGGQDWSAVAAETLTWLQQSQLGTSDGNSG